MFNDILFWCEFPEEVDWKRLNSLLEGKKCRIFFASRSVEEYESYRKRIKNSAIKTGVWPILPLQDGYWFSGFTSRKNIDFLKEFSGIPMKIDIEPPFPGKEYTHAKAFAWMIDYMLIKTAPNNEYLAQTIQEVSKKNEVIVSGFALPKNIRKHYGDPINLKLKRNFICYSTFFPASWLFFEEFLFRNKGPLTYAAIGLANHGIFGNEPEYDSLDEFVNDVKKVKKAGIQNIVVYSIEGILKKPDADEWLRVVFE